MSLDIIFKERQYSFINFFCQKIMKIKKFINLMLLLNVCRTLKSRDWFPKFANGLNIKIDIVHKVCIWVTKVSFCQNDPIIGESFWQKNSLVTLVYFELCLFWYFANSQILGISLYIQKLKILIVEIKLEF